jgi:murein DD-endopeptidase MepM/ murein hydrolase activator NlpD
MRSGYRFDDRLEVSDTMRYERRPWRAGQLTVASLVATSALLLPVRTCAQVDDTRLVSWEPQAPVQGTLFRVVIAQNSEVTSATGTAAGEPLHFQRGQDGRLTAFAAAPLDLGEKLELNVVLERGGNSGGPVRFDVPVAVGTYQLDRLSVAPQFGRPPDPATTARINRDRARALEVSKRSHETPRMWESFVQPRTSRITSGFGNGREFNGKVQSRHTGTDFAGEPGAAVNAAARGLVALVDNFYLAGNVVYIDHGHGIVTAYFHLSETLVQEGDTVSAGQTIGKVGATGRVTGPHLHWMVRYGTISVDPMSFLAFLGT